MYALPLALAIMGSSPDLTDSFRQLVDEALATTQFADARVWTKGAPLGGFDTFGEGRRPSDRAAIYVEVGRGASRERATRKWNAMGPSLVYTDPYAPFSELPLGASTRRHSGNGSTSVESHEGQVVVKVQITYRGTGPRGSVLWHVVDRDRDKRITEGLTRRLLAGCNGLSATTASNTTVAGTPVSTIGGLNGERLVDLSRFCQVLGIALHTNYDLGTASFTSGGELVVIPLAAKKIKDGSRWIETTDISLIKDGKWYVSFAALQDARLH